MMMMKLWCSWAAGCLATVSAVTAAETPTEKILPDSIRTVALIAPSSPVASPEKLDDMIARLEKTGVKVKLMPHAREKSSGGSFSSIEPGKRVADIEQAWLDPEVDLIWCIRGGAGATGIIGKLNWENLRTRPDMPVLGFSDITALHMAMLKEKAGHPYAAPTLTMVPSLNAAARQSLTAVLSGTPPEPVQLQVLKPGEAAGTILAGHAGLLADVSGGRFAPNAAGKVVFIECPRDEKTVRKLMDILMRRKFFARAAAVVFGHFEHCKDNGAEIMRELAAKVSCPVFAGFPYGHLPDNHTLDLRGRVRIDATGMLYFESSL